MSQNNAYCFVTPILAQEEQAFMDLFKKHDFSLSLSDQAGCIPIAHSPLCKEKLLSEKRSFIDWSLLRQTKVGSTLELSEITSRLNQRLTLLAKLPVLESHPCQEHHASIRVKDLANSTSFYAWLFQMHPKEWTHRYAIFQGAGFNFVLVVADDKELHRDTLYHLGRMVDSKDEVIQWQKRAEARGVSIEKPARTTWMGTPLHELWLHDPDGTLIEVYARLKPEDYEHRPLDLSPIFLV